MPLGHRIKRVKTIFNKAVSSFFITYRFLNSLAIINMLAYLGLLISHICEWDNKNGSFTTLSNNSIFPVFVLYSSFDTHHGASYSQHLFFFILIVTIASGIRWVLFDYDSKRNNIFYDQKNFFSRQVLNAWDWDIKT